MSSLLNTAGALVAAVARRATGRVLVRAHVSGKRPLGPQQAALLRQRLAKSKQLQASLAANGPTPQRDDTTTPPTRLELLRARASAGAAAPTAPATPTIETFDDVDAFNRAANHAKPNTVYRFGTYEWSTDGTGRVSHVEGRIHLKKHGRQSTDGVTTVSIGQSDDAEEGDVGFHLIGDQFDGPINLLNVVPGNGVSFKALKSLNLSGYKKWENTIARLAASRQVRVRIKLVYSADSKRPDTITAAYLDDNGDWVKKTFKNKAGG